VAGALALWLPAATSAQPVDLSSEPGEPLPPVFCAPEEPPPLVEGVARQGAAAPALAFPGLPYRVVLPGLAYLAGPPPLAPPADDLLALRDRLAAEIAAAGTPGEFAFAVTDLQTGEHISVNGERQQRAACVMNLFAIIAALRDVQAGFFPLQDVDALIRQTIYASDAVTGRVLYEKVGAGDVVAGVGRVRQLQRDVIGMQSTQLDHPPAFPGDSLGLSADNLVTADDANLALSALYHGQLLDAGLTAWLIDAMVGVKPGLNYLTAALPAGATVSHKNGFVPLWDGYVDNDVAIVRFGPGLRHAYAVSFFSQGVPVQYADIPLAQALVRMTWEHFNEKYC
jgi:beta-lactamase class A